MFSSGRPLTTLQDFAWRAAPWHEARDEKHASRYQPMSRAQALSLFLHVKFTIKVWSISFAIIYIVHDNHFNRQFHFLAADIICAQKLRICYFKLDIRYSCLIIRSPSTRNDRDFEHDLDMVSTTYRYRSATNPSCASGRVVIYCKNSPNAMYLN